MDGEGSKAAGVLGGTTSDGRVGAKCGMEGMDVSDNGKVAAEAVRGKSVKRVRRGFRGVITGREGERDGEREDDREFDELCLEADRERLRERLCFRRTGDGERGRCRRDDLER